MGRLCWGSKTVARRGRGGRGTDTDFIAVGASGNVFDIDNNSASTALSFGFDVKSVTFIYGGNFGVIDLQARDINGTVVAAFFQADTDAGQPAGPVSLSAAGIRSLLWTDPGSNFAALDNLQIVTRVPEPSTPVLAAFGALGLLVAARRRAA